MADIIIKKWNGTGWEEHYPKTTVGQIVASGTPSSTTFLRGDGTWSFVPIVTKSDLTWTYVYGKAEVNITKGQALQFAGVQGDHILLKPAVPSEINANPDYFVGLAEANALANDFIYVVDKGEIRDLNTVAYPSGTILWYQSEGTTAGLLRTTEPSGNVAKIQVGAVTKSNETEGIILVRVNFFGVDIEDIKATGTPSNTTFLRGDGTWGVPASASGDFLPLTGGTLSGGLNIELSAGGNSHIGLDVGSSTFNNYLTTTANGTTFFRSFTPSPATYTTRMVIKGDGNVGIGTTEPNAKLHVSGGSVIIGTSATAPQALSVFGNIYTNGYLTWNNGDVELGRASGATDFYIKTYTGSSLTEKMRVTAAGNVGIGNISPDQKLVVGGAADTRVQVDSSSTQGIYFTKSGTNNGTFRTSADGDFEFFTKSVNQALVLKAGGNVGIGTPSPSNKLHILDTNPRVILQGTGAGNNVGYRFVALDSGSDSRTGGYYFQPITGTNQSYLGLTATDGAYQMIVRADGNVGIGTTSPSAKLDVDGGVDVRGNLRLTGSGTTTNQSRTIEFTGFDKEGTTDFSDNAYIRHTVNSGGLAGSVLEISSQNDNDDGINFITNSSNTFRHNGSVIITGNNIGSQSVSNAATATIVNGTSGQLRFKDDRVIEPNSINAERLQFGFTSFSNNNTAPWADYLHLRSYSDGSGGSDNLVVFKKDGIGMRIYQQTFGSASAYSTFKDVAFTDSNITGNAATATNVAYSGLTGTVPTWNQNTTGNAATSTRVVNGTTNPASTQFNNTLAATAASSRVVNFDGVGTTPSVWWTNGSRAYGAIDATDPGLAFWANNGSSWQQQVAMGYGTFNVLTTLQQAGNQVWHAGNLTNLNQLTNGPGYITSSGSISGNASTATTWQTARTLTIGNTGKSVNGSGNVSWSLAEIGAYAATNPSNYTSYSANQAVNTTSNVTFNNLSITGADNLFNKNNPAISNTSYVVGNNNIELRTTNGSNVILGFHRSGFTAVALYHDVNNSLRLRDANTGIDSLMWHSSNLTNLNQLTNGPGYITSSGQAARATDANEMRSNFSTATFSFQGTTFGTMNSSNLNPNGSMAKSLGASNAFWLGVWTCTIYRTSESGLSDVYSKKDIRNIVINGVPIYQPESLKEIEVTEEEENFFEGVKTLFEKLTIYTFNYIGSETNKPDKIGVMAQEIEEVLEGYPLLLSLLIQEVSEEIKDNEGNVIETKVQKYLRTDNLDTLKTIMIKYIYFKVKNLEEAVKQANETIAKIKYVLVNKEVATEEELV